MAQLTEELGAPRTELEAAIAQLETWGYTFKTARNRLHLTATPDSLTATELKWGLNTGFIGQRLLAYNKVKSTNDIVSREGAAGGVEGTVAVAEQQTGGRGRLGRGWHSPKRKGIYLSILLRPEFLPEHAPGLSLMTALALAKTIEATEKIRIKIKWPNDLILNDRKVAGILTELAAERRRINYVVIGVGINANQDEQDFPEELRQSATSIRMAVGHEISRVRLVQNFFREFEREYQLYCREFLAPSLPRLRRYSTLLGEKVRLASGLQILEGVAVDIEPGGGLVIERGGKRHVVTAGDVTVVKE
ncbi:MAG TPA: biotin--[acetyl-CoA-carboxylase] ligase [candidate division Zixibacteria bacterium]|nr:biotin--[acetyl-CoA-carboxylase] ligase [candidate division Zixibacteria bacterium]MDD4917287.1 biotin--[acetyl-CoA-carboxylase] ligase [candidate division Zixibacteria bacterium]HOD65441.1 biotin--[acetyl-CoA-carboxylase] ligase [candidate division Zixibacteria bacterium]HPM36783.1 biotin--[acetyl-CoA-carboxylase] ligase [candidate division Zixibacteria bacterium]